MKARFKYRFYPTNQQQQSLAQLFGCVRVVWNDSLALCKQSEKKPSSVDLQKIVITQAKKTEERAWLSEVSNIPLQQSVADLEAAFKNFFNSCKGKRKGGKVGYPKLSISQIVNALKGVSSRRYGQAGHEKPHKEALWSPSYFALSVGGAPLEVLKQYIRNQEKPS